MRKYGFFWIILDCFAMFMAIVKICYDIAEPYDYFILFATAEILILLAARVILKEIRIQKNLKKMREKEKKQKDSAWG